MSSHYQSLFQCNESFLVLWSKRESNPHLSRLSVSHSASYNLVLNLYPLGPKLLDRQGCPATAQVIPSNPHSIHFNCSPKTFTTTVGHSVSRLGFARSAGSGSRDGRTVVVLGREVLTLGCVYCPLPPSNPDDKTYGLRYDVAGQCLIAKPHKSPRLLSQSRPVSVDQTVRTQPQIKIKGESGPCCIVPVFVLHISIESQSTLSTWTHIFLF